MDTAAAAATSGRGGGRDFGGGGRGGRKNELGFYGDMRPNERLEKNLFPAKDQTQGGGGINFNNYDKIPVEMSGEDCPEPIEGFPLEVFGDALATNLQRCHYTKPTPVQKYALPVGLAGRDMMACAQTGSGKTGGFIFPVLVALCRDGAAQIPDDNGRGSRRSRAQPNALVLAPTRELVSQIFDEAQKFCYLTGVRPVVCYGGAETEANSRSSSEGVIYGATPGRLVDFLERGRVTLAACKFLVLDEADRILEDMGFEPQIRRIVEQEDMPQTGQRQTFMFSATFPREMQMMAGDFLNDYVFLTVGRVGAACKDVTQSFQFVDGRDKPEALMRYLSNVDQHGLTPGLRRDRSAMRTSWRMSYAGRASPRRRFTATRHEEPRTSPAGLQGRPHAHLSGHGCGRSRPRHPERAPRHQLRPAAPDLGLRPPHRPHGPRRQHGLRHVVHLRQEPQHHPGVD